MIIGEKRQYVFISTPKAGTKSMYDLLRREFSGVHAMDMIPGVTAYHHRDVPEAYRSFFRFGIVRNPWSRAVAIWWALVRWRPDIQSAKEYMDAAGGSSFEAFTRLLAWWEKWVRSGIQYCLILYPQAAWHKDLGCTKILHLERVGEEMRALPFVTAPVRVPKLRCLETQRRPWQEYYRESTSGEAAENVRTWAGDGFEQFGYSAETP